MNIPAKYVRNKLGIIMLSLHLIAGYDPSKPNSEFAILTLYSNKKNFYVFGTQNNSLKLKFSWNF